MTRATSNPIVIVFDLAPVPASRPRVGKFGTYYAKGYADWMKEAAGFVKDALDVPTHAPLEVDIECVCKRPAKPTSTVPIGDVDNYAKGPLDVITKSGVVWGDDKQVVSLRVSKRFAAPGEAPHTKATIREAAWL